MRRAVVIEALANLAAVVVLPLIASIGRLQGTARSFGMGQLVDQLTGAPTATDIGWEVAGARALVEPGFSPYDELTKIAHLISMTPYDAGVHTHPPTSFVPWLVLAFFPYGTWIAAFTVLSISATAVTMRVLDVPAWIAYPVALLLAITPVGAFAMATTYPVMALLLALAWRFRDRPFIAGPAYALLASGRGVAGLMLVYPLLRRQWRVLAVALSVLAALLFAAVIAQPDVISDFLSRGQTAIAFHSARGDLFAPQAMLARHGLPSALAWVAIAVVAVIALLRKQEPFWLLAWLSLAVSPIAWGQTALLALPLLVVMWRSGRIGAALTFVAAFASLVVVAPAQANAIWPLILAITGIGLMACPLSPAVPVEGRVPS